MNTNPYLTPQANPAYTTAAAQPVEVLQRTPGRIARVLQTTRAQLRAFDEVTWNTPEDRQIAIDELCSLALAEVVKLQQAAADAKTDLDRVLNAARSALGGSTEQQLLAERLEWRAWQRIKQVLDAGGSWRDAVREATEAGDVVALRALRAELPAWLIAKNAKGDLQPAQDAITAGLWPLLPVDQQQAAQLEAEAYTGYRQVVAAFDQAQAELNGKQAPAPTLPGWNPEQPLQIESLLERGPDGSIKQVDSRELLRRAYQ